jgi:hypothetical protein
MMDEIERTAAAKRKENLAAMRGARDAMSTALDHIATLETALNRCVSIGGDLRRMIGNDAMVTSYFGPKGAKEIVSAQTLLDEMYKTRARAAAK